MSISLLLLLLAPAWPGVARAAGAERRCFAETGRCVEGRFLAYWEAHGGLARNGFPLTDLRYDTLEDGKAYTVQYFERVRLEYHPENQPPDEVLLGQFGRRIHGGVDPPLPPPSGPITADRVYIEQTGHFIVGAFFNYWYVNGGVAQFGYPITEQFEERLEDGQVYRVQYFERARFEWHPENQPPYDILLGQFGRRILAEVDGQPLGANDAGAADVGIRHPWIAARPAARAGIIRRSGVGASRGASPRSLPGGRRG